MVDIVPRIIILPKDSTTARVPMTEVPFRIESLNLEYWVGCAQDASIASLAEIVAERIVKPLGAYDRNKDWVACRNFALALQSDPEVPLPPQETVGSIAHYGDPDSPLKPGDSFVALITRTVLLHPGETFRITIEPNPPVAGKPYVIAINGVPGTDIEVEVNGSDGFSRKGKLRLNRRGETRCRIPGAERGVKDDIWIHTDSDEAKISIEFYSRA
jgi:hypothetical protein